jgi:hypothetical protein
VGARTGSTVPLDRPALRSYESRQAPKPWLGAVIKARGVGCGTQLRSSLMADAVASGEPACVRLLHRLGAKLESKDAVSTSHRAHWTVEAPTTAAEAGHRTSTSVLVMHCRSQPV